METMRLLLRIKNFAEALNQADPPKNENEYPSLMQKIARINENHTAF